MIPPQLKTLKINQLFKINGQEFLVTNIIKDAILEGEVPILDAFLTRTKDNKKFNLVIPLKGSSGLHLQKMKGQGTPEEELLEEYTEPEDEHQKLTFEF